MDIIENSNTSEGRCHLISLLVRRIRNFLQVLPRAVLDHFSSSPQNSSDPIHILGHSLNKNAG